jgi:hypothetical protein
LQEQNIWVGLKRTSEIMADLPKGDSLSLSWFVLVCQFESVLFVWHSSIWTWKFKQFGRFLFILLIYLTSPSFISKSFDRL